MTYSPQALQRRAEVTQDDEAAEEMARGNMLKVQLGRFWRLAASGGVHHLLEHFW